MTKKDQTISKAFSLLRDGKASEGAELLYLNCYAQMYGIAFSILKNEDKSRDAVHNVISKLLSLKADRLPVANESGWLYVVVKNEAVDLIKSESRLLSLDESFAFDIEHEDDEIKSLVDMDAYEKMISRLDTERQEIVTLKVLGGFTHREIAEILGKPIGTVQWLYATAIAKLRKSVIALFIISIISSFGVIRRLINTDRPGGGTVEKPGDIPDGGMPPTDVPIDYLAIILGIIATLCIVALISLIFGKLRTKKSKKKK